MHIATEPVKSRAEADKLAQALLDKLANGYIAADGIAPGQPQDPRAGRRSRSRASAAKFSGTYRVATSTHVLRGGGLRDELRQLAVAHDPRRDRRDGRRPRRASARSSCSAS